MDSRRRNQIIVALIALAIFLLAGWWFLYGRSAPETARNVPPSNSINFFPISGTQQLPPDASSGDTGDAPQGRIPTLRQLSETPTSGAIAYEKVGGQAASSTKSAVYFRWVERATGNVYETRDDDLTKKRLSNATVPGVQEAYFSGDAKQVLLRYLRPDNETVETALGSIKSVTATTSDGLIYSDTKLVTTFLPSSVEQVAPSPDGQSFAELVSTGDGSQVRVSPFSGGDTRAVFASPLAEWNLSWPSASQIAISTRPAPDVGGYLYNVDVASGVDTKILQGVPGLTAIQNPKGTRVLYSEASGGDLHLHVRNLENGSDRILKLRGLTDKCAWSRTNELTVYCAAPDRFFNGDYPINWYQGRISFDDNIWRIDVDEEKYTFLFDSTTEPQKFDAYKLTVAPHDQFLVFGNKKDLTLWSIDLRAR